MNARKHHQPQRLSNDSRRKVFLKASDFFLDLAKLVFAGIILTGIVDLDVNKVALFIIGSVVTVLLASLGYLLLIQGIRKG